MMESLCNILVVNPGSTSTKVAVFAGLSPRVEGIVRHTAEELRGYAGIPAQQAFRTRCLLDFLRLSGVQIEAIDAVVGRGGILGPMESGTYAVNKRMLLDLRGAQAAIHASCLGGIIAAEIAAIREIPAYIVDPVCVDELEPIARFSGLPEIKRISTFHALNTKAVARIGAAEIGLRYEDGCFVVAHMGGGISVGAHRYGRVVDVNDALDGDGPFSPERSGSMPLIPLVEMCFSGAFTREEIIGKIRSGGGMLAYLGTNDMREAQRRMDSGDDQAALVVEAMAYQVSKEIGAMAAVLEGQANAVLLTGGLAHSAHLVASITRRVQRLAPVRVYPGEREMEALAAGAFRVLTGQEEAKRYEGGGVHHG